MNNVEFLSKGTTVYCLQVNKIYKYTIEDIYINVKNNQANVQYDVKNVETQNKARLEADFLFTTLESLKQHILSEFDKLKEEESGEQEKEKE